MHSATTATGRPHPPSRKTLPKSRPAPLTARAPRHPAAPNPHVTPQLQCYIPAPAVTRLPRARSAKGHSFTQSAFCEGSLITRHCKSNRQPVRLEIVISPTKQTPAPRFNRQQLRTLHPAFFAGPAASRTTARSSRNTARRESRPHFSIQMDAFAGTIIRATRSKQTIASILIRYKRRGFSLQSASPQASAFPIDTTCD